MVGARGPSWASWNVIDTTNGPEVRIVRAPRFRPAEEGAASDKQWLVVAREALGKPVTMNFLSNAPEDTPQRNLLHVAFSRWQEGGLFRERRTEIGLDQYEGRTRLGFKRKLGPRAASILFLAQQRKRWRDQPDDFGPPTLRHFKRPVEVQLDPEMPIEERRRQLDGTMEINASHPRRNEAASRSQEKQRLREFGVKGIDLTAPPLFPVTL